MHCGPVAGPPTVLMGGGTGVQCLPASGVLSCKIIVPSSWASLVAQMVKNLTAMRETQVQSLGQEDPLKKGIATHSSILAWSIPGREEPGRLESTG